MKSEDWFELDQTRPYLYTIRERLDKIDSRFYTAYTNMYLLLGDHTALLFDTGSGVANLSSFITDLVDERDLLVLNSHNHFDHIGSNHQFDETHIHYMDFKKLMKPYSLEFLRGCNPEFEPYFDSLNWKMDFAPSNIPLVGNEIFDLGGIEVQIKHLPGHTPGSICMWTNLGDLFTGDTLHYGGVFLPDRFQRVYLEQSIEDLDSIVNDMGTCSIFPGHEDYDLTPQLLSNYQQAYDRIDDTDRDIDTYLQAEIYRMEKFTFIRPLKQADV